VSRWKPSCVGFSSVCATPCEVSRPTAPSIQFFAYNLSFRYPALNARPANQNLERDVMGKRQFEADIDDKLSFKK
jgi:hypothetical protein